MKGKICKWKEYIKGNIFIFVCIVLLVVIVLLSYSSITLIRESRSLEFKYYSANEENIDLRAEIDKLSNALGRDHKTALANDTKLLVANLAWLDQENGTRYASILINDLENEVPDYAKLKKLFDEDKDARNRAVEVVCKYLDRTDIYTVGPDFYDYIVSDDYIKSLNQ